MDVDNVERNKEISSQNNELIGEIEADSLLSLGSSDADSIVEEIRPLPRLGEEYQAQIPTLISEYAPLKLSDDACCCSDELSGDRGYIISVGLPIPIMWVPQVDHDKREEKELLGPTTYEAITEVAVESMNSGGGLIYPKHDGVGGHLHENYSMYASQRIKSSAQIPDDPSKRSSCIEPSDNSQEQGKEVFITKGQTFDTLDDQLDLASHGLLPNVSKSLHALPEYPLVSWSDTDFSNFLLGLYIFGKNLVQIRKLMERQNMGDILSFYYGKFYRSDAYRRWSECRKIKSRRCIHGQRIFTGWRQQELLSRITCGVSNEVQNSLLEASRTFNDGRMSLEEYVFTIKALVGVGKLAEAVAIGKGKRDLTGIVMDPIKTNTISILPEIPVGKACSSLTSEDIVKFLTGDFRLSKAKSNDLFWEAVWPRLLANGWHSEQPLDLASVGSKSTLVFLIPGIKKFSRKRLTKGNHYFDSIRDVLNKVGSDPKLLELEIEGGANSKEPDHNVPFDNESRNYLRPKLPKFNSELMKFTIVDTSMYRGEAPPCKLRGLRNLPIDAFNTSDISSPSEKTESESLEEQPDVMDKASSNQGVPSLMETNKAVKMESDPSEHLVNLSKKRIPENGYNSIDQSQDILCGKKTTNGIENHSRFGLKSGQPIFFAPVLKRRRLSACKQAESRHRTSLLSRGKKLNKEKINLEWGPFIKKETKVVEPGLSQETRFSSSHFAKGSSYESGNYCSTGSPSEATLPKRKEAPQPRSFDLNLPQFVPETETTKPGVTDLTRSHHVSNDSSLKPGTNPEMDGFQESGISQDIPTMQETTANGLRQSKRTRPLTNKTPEAFQCGFLYTRDFSLKTGTNQEMDGFQASGTSQDIPTMQEMAANGPRQSKRTRPLTNKTTEAFQCGFLYTRDSSLKPGTNQEMDGFQASGTSQDIPTTQEAAANGPRQSTRTRPTTNKTLEAFQCGFLYNRDSLLKSESNQETDGFQAYGTSLDIPTTQEMPANNPKQSMRTRPLTLEAFQCGFLYSGDSSLKPGTNQEMDGFKASGTSHDIPTMQETAANGPRQSTRTRPLTNKTREAFQCGFLYSPRQSTRTRPPTTKALEAFECGFLYNRRKDRAIRSHPTSRPSQQARRPARPPKLSSPMNVDSIGPNTMIQNVRMQEGYESYLKSASNSAMQEFYTNYRSYTTNHSNIYMDSLMQQSESKETRELQGNPSFPNHWVSRQ